MAKTRIPSLDQMDLWVATGREHKILDALKGIPDEQLNPEQTLRLAQALNNTGDPGDPEGRKKFRRALGLLQSIEPNVPQLEDKFAWYFAIGFSWFFLDHPVEALPYFRKAAQLVPYDENAKWQLQLCLQASRRPKARRPFREGVWKAWEAFENQQPAILKQLDEEQQGQCSRKLERIVSACLELAFTKPSCSVWKTEGKPCLVCNTGDSIVKMIAILQFFQQAPAGIQEAWDFRVGPLPDQRSQKVKTFLQNFGENPVQLFSKGGKYRAVKLGGPDLHTLSRSFIEDPATTRFLDGLKTLLGYVPYTTLCSPVPQKTAPDKLVDIQDLPQVLKAGGVDCSEESAEALLELCPYNSKGVDSRKYWRQAAESGQLRLPTLLLSPEGRTAAFSDETVQDGMEGGFLVWPITAGFKKKVREAAEQQAVEIQGLLLEQLGAECIYPMGRAVDNNFAYLDFIAWDLQPVLEAAAKLLEKAGLPWAVYRPYRDCDPATSLFGFDAPPLHKD